MELANKKDANTPCFWDEYWGGERSKYEGHPCPDVISMLGLLSRGCNRALDIGCGAGPYFPYIHAAHIDGIDISAEGVARAQAAYPAATVVQGDISQRLPYPDSCFDLVYCGEVLEHVREPKLLVDEIHRVLVLRGVCVLNTPFENKIPAESHIWYICRADLVNLFLDFKRASIYRFDNSPTKDWWEHFLVVAVK